MTIRRASNTVLLACVAALLLSPRLGVAQSRVGKDSATRLTRFGRNLAYGAVVGLGYAGVDQWRNSPSEWGKSWSGYGRRAASNVGEFVIQEGVTEGLAAVMNRPLDFTPCKCTGTGKRIGWAAREAFFDDMPDGSQRIAVPRIVGSYVGSAAQAMWRPGHSNKVGQVLLNGTTSLGLGVFINMFYEFRHGGKTQGAITSR